MGKEKKAEEGEELCRQLQRHVHYRERLNLSTRLLIGQSAPFCLLQSYQKLQLKPALVQHNRLI